jgi:DoxX-like family
MDTAYPVVAIALAAIAAFSGVGKLRRDAKIVHIVHEVVGVPLKYFHYLATCEFAGALRQVLGIWWPLLGVEAAIGLVAYFAGTIASHVRVGDVKGIGPAAFLLAISVVALGPGAQDRQRRLEVPRSNGASLSRLWPNPSLQHLLPHEIANR